MELAEVSRLIVSRGGRLRRAGDEERGIEGRLQMAVVLCESSSRKGLVENLILAYLVLLEGTKLYGVFIRLESRG